MLAIDVENAGSLLHGLDVTQEIQDGVLRVSGVFDDTTRDHTLAGTLDLTNFRVVHANVVRFHAGERAVDQNAGNFASPQSSMEPLSIALS